MKTTVSIVRCENYEQRNVDNAVQKSLELIGGLDRFVKPGDKVLLKVNLLMPRPPEKGVTTHPAVIEALAKLAKGIGAKPIIGDSSMWMTKQALRVCGVDGVAAQIGAESVNLDSYTPVEIENPDGVMLKKIHVAGLIRDVDVIISVPKLKVHELTMFTGAVKNMFGIIPGRAKSDIHKKASSPSKFCDALLDINSIATPDLAVMDGVVSVEGSAGIGRTRKMGVILASSNSIALDTVASALVGYDPDRLPLNKAARRRGLKGASLSEIEIVGEPMESVRNNKFGKPPSVMPLVSSMPWLNPFLTSGIKPSVSRTKCTACKICERSCPVGAIKVDEYPKFDYEKCIRCFCCKEGCQEEALQIKVPLLAGIVARMFDW